MVDDITRGFKLTSRDYENMMTPIERDMAGVTQAHYSVLRRLKEVSEHNIELVKKIERLGGEPNQMEFDF